MIGHKQLLHLYVNLLHDFVLLMKSTGIDITVFKKNFVPLEVVKKLCKILILIFVTFFFHGLSSGEKVIILTADSVGNQAVTSYSNLPSGNSYLFADNRQTEKGIDTHRVLNQIYLSDTQDDSYDSALVEANIQRRMAIFLHSCRTVNQYSKLTKLIYPFHFFF